MKPLLIKHVRDANHVPFATIVMLKNGQYGVSVCSTKDMFSRHRGTEIACGRAVNGNYDVNMHDLSGRSVECYDKESDRNYVATIHSVVCSELDQMEHRAYKYFKWGGI